MMNETTPSASSAARDGCGARFTYTPGFAASGGFGRAVRSGLTEARRLAQLGNRRSLLVRNPRGETVVRLSATIAAVLALLLLWNAALPFVGLVVVMLVLRYEFVLTNEAPAKPEGHEPGV